MCISDPSKRQAHNAIHAFFAIVTTQDEALYASARAQAQPQGVRHYLVECDSCGQSPLIGVRHRCRECRGEFTVMLGILDLGFTLSLD